MGSGEAKCGPARIWRWARARGQWEGAERPQQNHGVSKWEGGVVAAGRGLSSELLFKTLSAWVLALRPPVNSERPWESLGVVFCLLGNMCYACYNCVLDNALKPVIFSPN